MKKWVRICFTSIVVMLLDVCIFFTGDTYLGKDFLSSIVDTEEKVVQNGGNAGNLIFGPYLSYEKGKYYVYIYGATDTENNLVDIYSGINAEQYYIGKFRSGEKISLELEQDVSDLEIRVYYAGTGTLRIDKVVVVERYGVYRYLVMIIISILVGLILGFDIGLSNEGKIHNVLIFCMQFIKLYIASFMIVIIIRYLRTEKRVPLEQFQFLFLAINACIVFLVLAGIFFITRRIGISVLVGSIVFFVLAIVDYNYYNIRGESFKISEITLAGEAADVIGGYPIKMPHMLVPMVLLLLCIVFSLGIRRKQLKRDVRILGLAGCILCFVVFYSNVEYVIEKTGNDPRVYMTKNFYDVYGYILGLIRTAPHEMQKPEKYSQEYVKEILGDNLENEIEQGKIYPNIIYIQNETFYDLERVTEANWNENPMEEFADLQDEYTSGTLISPMTGGGTCNVEYEALTAYPYSRTGGTPYSNLIKRGTDSIVSILNEQGYQTEAIHLNTGNFFNRKEVYTNLGFDKMIFSEDISLRENDVLYNGWFSDASVYQRLIEEYENRDKKNPYFAHVVTTQNHGPYAYAYDEHGIVVEQDMDEDNKRQLQTYLNLQKESVESLRELLQYFETVSEPTIVVFWGDHCPGLSLLGISVDNSMDSYMNAHMTPFLIWNNYGIEKSELGAISAYNISPYVLKLAGINTDVYMNYMYNHAAPNTLEQIEIISEDKYEYIQNWDSKKSSIWNNIWMLQYDRMFGKKYSAK